jgi:hypothetical protein
MLELLIIELIFDQGNVDYIKHKEEMEELASLNALFLELFCGTFKLIFMF